MQKFINTIRWHLPYKLFGFIKKHWIKADKPCERFVLFVRHRLLGTLWPAETIFCPDSRFIQPKAFLSDLSVAVIIPCHNYAHFLPEAIESVLNQTFKPTEILIVDDDSDDNTAEIASTFSDRGVRYIKCNHRNLAKARNEGAENTSSAFLLFLDADDILPSHYIKRCLKQMQDPSVAIVYGNMKHFENERFIWRTSEFKLDRIERTNFISSHALIRRKAFDMVDGYKTIPDSIAEDWDFYRRVLRLRWKAKKARTYVKYRVHDKSMTNTSTRRRYMDDASLKIQPLTIFTIFSGDHKKLDSYIHQLKTVNINKDHSRIIFVDTSGDKSFETRLKDELSKLKSKKTTYTRLYTIKKSSRKLNELRAISVLINSCDTELIFMVGEDTTYESDIAEKLFEKMDSNVSAVLSDNNINLCLLRLSALKNVHPGEDILEQLKRRGHVKKLDITRHKSQAT
jgi:glycosyltransferase involved in cell wall biosynthesis